MLVAPTSSARAADFDDCRLWRIDPQLETDRTRGNRRVALEMFISVKLVIVAKIECDRLLVN
jgi:hypothetical protein